MYHDCPSQIPPKSIKSSNAGLLDQDTRVVNAMKPNKPQIPMQTADDEPSTIQLSGLDKLAALKQETTKQTTLHEPNASPTLQALRNLSLSYQFRGQWDCAEEIQRGIIATKESVPKLYAANTKWLLSSQDWVNTKQEKPYNSSY